MTDPCSSEADAGGGGSGGGAWSGAGEGAGIPSLDIGRQLSSVRPLGRNGGGTDEEVQCVVPHLHLQPRRHFRWGGSGGGGR